MKMQCSGLDPAAGKEGCAAPWVMVQDKRNCRYIFYRYGEISEIQTFGTERKENEVEQ